MEDCDVVALGAKAGLLEAGMWLMRLIDWGWAGRKECDGDEGMVMTTGMLVKVRRDGMTTEWKEETGKVSRRK